MTEELAELMHRAADTLAIPPAPSAEVIRHGRAVRRRRHVALASGAALAVLVAGSGVGLALTRDGGSGDRPDRVADPARVLRGPVFSIGTAVYFDGGTKTVTIGDRAVKSLYYTSAGVLVRHGNNNASDGGGPMRFSLVSPDATVHPLDVTFEETVPSTDPDEPYLAYAEVVDDVVQVVVLDVRDGSEVARVPVPDAHTWGGWTAPPVALDGDLVYVGTDDVLRVVDWKDGDVTTTDALEPGYPDVRGGHAIQYDESGRSQSVVDVATGSTIVTGAKDEYLRLSPDGRYAVGNTFGPKPGGVRLFNLATGTAEPLDLRGDGLGWSPDDDVFTLTGSKLTTCPAQTGTCTTATLDLAEPPGDKMENYLRLGGATYES